MAVCMAPSDLQGLSEIEEAVSMQNVNESRRSIGGEGQRVCETIRHLLPKCRVPI